LGRAYAPGQAHGFARDTLHEATVAEEDVGLVVEKLEAILVVDGAKVGLGNGKTDGVRDTWLTSRMNINTVQDVGAKAVADLGREDQW
jgi:hypothetical protein